MSGGRSASIVNGLMNLFFFRGKEEKNCGNFYYGEAKKKQKEQRKRKRFVVDYA